jgi:pseudaminic acid synthase
METPQHVSEIHIGDRVLGVGHPVFVIAEISANHHQQIDKALALIEAAAAAGADAVKLQTYTPESMTLDSDTPPFRIGQGTSWEGQRLFDLYQEAMTPWEWQEELKVMAEKLGMQCFSTPFDEDAVNFLVGLRVPALKVASFEVIDLELVEKIAKTNLPVLMSTGMASISEIDAAVATVRSAGTGELLLFRCNSAYPAAPSEMDLLTIPHMATTWGVPVGLSDHTLGVTAAVAAVALGACAIEKHLTLSRDEPGPDSKFSLEPMEFATLVHSVHEAEEALGRIRYGPSTSEVPSLAFRRSLFVVANVAKGETFTAETVRSIRPSSGLPPESLPLILGRRAAKDAEAGMPLTWDMIGAPGDA